MSKSSRSKNCPKCGDRWPANIEVCECGHVFVPASKPGKRKLNMVGFIHSKAASYTGIAILAPLLIFAAHFLTMLVMAMFGFESWINWIYNLHLEDALPFIPVIIACLAAGSIIGRGYSVKNYVVYHLSLILFFNIIYFWSNAYWIEDEGLIVLTAISINFSIIFSMIRYFSVKIEILKGRQSIQS